MKIFSGRILPFLRLVESWMRGTEKIPVRLRQARGQLGFAGMVGQVVALGRNWDASCWALSGGLFLLLMGMNYVPKIGPYLWLAFAPVVSAGMLQLALRKGPGGTSGRWDRLRWGVRCVVLNYTVLAWFFFFLVCGAAVAVLLAGLLDWFLVRIPFKRAWSFSLLHLAWIFPLIFFLGVIGKALRFYLGSYLALPLVARRHGGVIRSIGVSRTACRGSLGAVGLWVVVGWLASFLPSLAYLGGTGLLIYLLTIQLSATFASLWKIYAISTLLYLICFFLALVAWPLGFLIQAAAYRRVFGESEGSTSDPTPTG
ncbi:hypothetical protein EBT23_04460 [bacterium]|nr:hypothetical protein [bacterium]